MATIVTRAGKGSPLTNTEGDNNFSNLNSDKIEAADITFANLDANGDVGAGAAQVPAGDHTHPYLLLAGGTLTGLLKLLSFAEKAISYTVTAGTKVLNLETGTFFYPAGDFGTAAITFQFDNPATTGWVTSFTMELLGANDATVTWPASVDWGEGGEPVWTAGTDIVSFTTRDGGTSWRGFAGGFDY